jgi:SET domain-containing protein
MGRTSTQTSGAAAAPLLPNLPRIRRRRSRLHGWGVFTTEPITKNTRIIDYAGEKIRNQESLKRERRYLTRGEIWCFKLNRHYARDAAVNGNVARFINHSCTPNCYSHVMGDTIWIRAARNIEAGEELTYNYFTDGAGTIPCRCRPGCKTML